MSAPRGAEILAAGMVTSVGLDAVRTAAAVRAGLSRFHESAIQDRRGEPIVLATVPDADLPRLHPSLAQDPRMTPRHGRMLCLAASALREALQPVSRAERVPLLLSLPEDLPGRRPFGAPSFLRWLGVQADLELAWDRSAVFSLGRAGGIAALEEALRRLSGLSDSHVLVGGVDTHLDRGLLDALDREGRLRGAGRMDGFTPGEGAGFVLVAPVGSAARDGRAPLASIDAAAMGREPGHRYSEEPYLGDGLDAALRALFAALPEDIGKVRTVHAGLNGEHFHAKEWGVAAIRHAGRLAEDLAVEHPADCLGDPGAALAPLLIGLAALGAQRGYRRPPCLVWCASDLQPRGAALLRAAGAMNADGRRR